MGFSVMDRPSIDRSIRRPLSVERWRGTLSVGLVVLAAALAANSVFGPLVLDAIDYPVSETMRNQTIGLDAANLLIVAPFLAFVGWLAWRRNRWAPLLALGPTTYVAYMFVQYIAGPDHSTYVRILPLQLIAFVAGWTLAALAWRSRPALVHSTIDHRIHAAVAVLFAGFVVLRYLPGLAGTVSEEPLPPEMQADLAMYWLIFLMDLGLFVPAAAGIAVGLWRGSEWAMPALTGLVGWYLLVTVAVGAMSITMVVNNDPYASTGQLALFAVMTVAVTAYAVVVAQTVRFESLKGTNGNRP